MVSVALLVARRTNNRKVVALWVQLTGNRQG